MSTYYWLKRQLREWRDCVSVSGKHGDGGVENWERQRKQRKRRVFERLPTKQTKNKINKGLSR